MTIEIKKLSLVEPEIPVEPPIDKNCFYLRRRNSSVIKEGLTIYEALYSFGEGRPLKFYLRLPDVKDLEIGMCNGEELKEYEAEQEVRLNPFQPEALTVQDSVLVIRRGYWEAFIIPYNERLICGWLFNTQDKSRGELQIPSIYSMWSSGFTISLAESGGLILSGDSFINFNKY